MLLNLADLVKTTQELSNEYLFAKIGFHTDENGPQSLPEIRQKLENKARINVGVDVPLACLSKLPRSPYDYLYQLFAQVTKPASDPLRAANVMRKSNKPWEARSLLYRRQILQLNTCWN